MRRWGIIYVRRNDRIVNDFVECFMDIVRRFGIEASRPHMFVLQNDDTKSYYDELKRLAPKSPQILLIIFPSDREDRYIAVKKLCNTELGIITQVRFLVLFSSLSSKIRSSYSKQRKLNVIH